MMGRIFRFVLCGLATASLAGEACCSTAAQVQRTVVSLVKQLRPEISSSDLSLLRPIREPVKARGRVLRYVWTCSTRFQVVTVDDRTGDVWLYDDGQLQNQASGGPESSFVAQVGRPFYHNERQLIQRAASVLDLIGWHHGPLVNHRPLPTPSATGQIHRSIVYVTFSDRPNAFPATSSGNFSLIGLDSLTGEAVALQQQTGFSYAPAGRPIKPKQALKIVRDAVGQSEVLSIKGLQYYQIDPDATLSARARSLYDSRTLALSYFVRTDREDFHVDAVTGEVLSRRDNAAGDGRSLKRRRRSSGLMNWLENMGGINDPSRPWLVMFCSSAMLIALGGLAVWRHSRRTVSHP